MKKKYFKLFSDCKLVAGIDNGLIYDLGKSKFYLINKEYCEFLQKIENKQIFEIEENFGLDAINIINELIEMDIGFITDNPSHFTDISLEFIKPSKVISAVIEFNNCYDIYDILDQLDCLGCKSITMVLISKNVDFSFLNTLMNRMNDSYLVSIELVLSFRYRKKITLDFYFKNLRIIRVLYLDAPKNTNFFNKFGVQVILSTEKSFSFEEKIDRNYFYSNTDMFCEAQNHNLGLNRKISINQTGEIKNYITHKKSFGNVNDVKLRDVINNPDFIKHWNIPNDLILKCKDCIYRYCCASNSELIKINEFNFIKKEYCNY